ncbi:hypothetical protein [Nannocystis pusilla]|uniref:hypothetical protein n=1 Tax=Nannocystis pusilla TaxID=889268 RepID=UPI003B7A0DBC
MVSFAGAVTVDAAPWTAGAGDTLTIKARGLRPKRAVFVDVRGPDGAWVDTLEPPVVGPEPPRTWSSAGLQPGLVQVEAYHFTSRRVSRRRWRGWSSGRRRGRGRRCRP